MNRREFLGSLVVLSSMQSTAEALALPSADSSSVKPLNDQPVEALTIPDLSHIPYSIAGSWLVVDLSEGRAAVKTVRRSAVSYRWQQTGPWADLLFEIVMIRDGKEAPSTITASMSSVRLASGDSSVEVISSDGDTFLIAAQHCGVHLRLAHPPAWIYQASDAAFRATSFHAYDQQSKTYLNLHADRPLIFQPAEMGIPYDTVTLASHSTQRMTVRCTTREEHPSDQIPDLTLVRTRRNDELDEWMRRCPDVPDSYQPAARTAWYLFSALQVSPEGALRRQTVLSSKKGMNMVWSWDNCINALALVKADPALAWDQLSTILDHQRADGVLPDAISDSEIVYGFNKPPVWAWTVQKLLPATPATDHTAHLEEVYPKIVRFHEWWFRERDLLGDGLPCYMCGNDSGWDNASIFAGRWPVQSPDLAAWLILDAEALAKIATQLDRTDEAARWREHERDLLARFHKRFWLDGQPHFFSLTPAGPERHRSTSLITSIPLLLGERLDPAIRRELVRSLSDPARFFAPAGPATEARSSPLYQPNGYWRGPVWGISTYLICTGLVECGETNLARTLATRFCETCARDGNFRENYDASTGSGQYDSGMTWTAADFLLLTNWLSTFHQ
ncbi:trehalase family glycosidase [Tunturibacter empetritectus]|uniref:Trehalase family glycosidase n=1 Tax=Tunturiibacter empetritectus TaxID=3069691 RepID=A0AAU7ZC56_9BACT